MNLYPRLLSLSLETTNRCNLQCSMCSAHGKACYEGQAEGHPAVMSFDFYKDILKQFFDMSRDDNQMRSIMPQYQGEPLMTPGFLEYCREIGKYRKFVFGFTTNACLLTSEISKELLNMKHFTSIAFSVDGFTKEVYESIRLGANFDKVMINIDEFLRLQNMLRPDFPVYMSFVRQQGNIHEYEQFVNFWISKVYGVNSSYICSRSLPMMMDWVPKEEERFPCGNVFNGMVILTNGKVVPCCRDYLYEIELGNLHNSSLQEIWHGEAYVNLRKLQLDRKWNEHSVCKNCYTWLDGSYPGKKQTILDDREILSYPYFQIIKRKHEL